jgi:hypothetical protein
MTKRKRALDVRSEAVAKRIVRACNTQFRTMNTMLLDIEPLAEAKEFNSIRRAVGDVLGNTALDILLPVFERFPHLDKHGVLKGGAAR